MAFNDIPVDTLKRKINELKRFLSISLSISNAHTVDFYTRDVWSTFMCVNPEEVLCAVSSTQDSMRAIEKENVWFLQCLKEVGGHISPAEGSESPLFTRSGGLYAAGRSDAESETDDWRHYSRTVIRQSSNTG